MHIKSPISLVQLTETLHYICMGSELEPWSFHLSTLYVEFLTTKLFDKKKYMLKKKTKYFVDINIFHN
jgi:hypothetical protein